MTLSKTEDLRSYYLIDNKEASEGKKRIDRYLKKNDVLELAHLLRHHNEKDINDEETFWRDEIDSFLDYFSLLSIAHITGYITYEELEEQSVEIAYYLGNASIKRYYYKNYPLLLPQILLETILHHKPFPSKNNTQVSQAHFQQFLSLNELINNKDANQFLWFIDGGSNDEYDIDDLKDTLRSPDLFLSIVKQTKDNALKQSVSGFLNFLDFLEQFNSFLNLIKDPINKAAYASFYQYWFSRTHNRLQSCITQFHLGLQKFISNNKDKPYWVPQGIQDVFVSRQLYNNKLNELISFQEDIENFTEYVKGWRGI